MALNLKDVARKANCDSEIIDGRTKVELENLIPAYPNGLTVAMCELAHTTDKKTGEPKVYCRVVFSEEPDKYINGGAALTKIVLAWIDSAGGDLALVNDSLKTEAVKIKAERIRLDNGNPYTAISIL